MTTPNSKSAQEVWKKQKGDYGKKSKLGRSAVNEISQKKLNVLQTIQKDIKIINQVLQERGTHITPN